MKLVDDDRDRIVAALSYRAADLRMIASGRKEVVRDGILEEAQKLDDLASMIAGENVHVR